MKKILSLVLAVCTLVSMLCMVPVSADDGDPAKSYNHVDAEYEDASLSLWFDYSSNKVSNTNTVSTGMESFSVYMAKNEIEDAQFVLYSDDAKTDLTAELSGFVNEAGDTLAAEIFVELYHDCADNGMVPDAIPPMSAHGPVDLTAGKSQAFLVKITSKEDSTAGWYSSDLYIKNASGQTVKQTKLFAYVWDFALSEATACATSINLDISYLKAAHPDVDPQEIYKTYYDYMLENRINAYYLPVKLYYSIFGAQGKLDAAAAQAYMDNPRVTSFQGDNDYLGQKYDTSKMNIVYNHYKGEENAHRFDKAYYFSNVVDAAKPADLEALKAYYDTLYSTLGAKKPDYATEPFWFINTYINDIDYTTADGATIDQIEYYKDFVNLWCSKTFAYTKPEELSTPGAKVMQDLKWNPVYGTFSERMAAKREAGQKVWWFISWDVEEPYINYYMQTDGTSQRILFWQQYDNGVQGFLYNFANFWLGDCSDPYNNNVTNSSFPNAHGESILLYPGSKFGINGPVGSLRFEAMRDGIEDYQMFSMLEEQFGAGAADSYIDKMTTGMVTYSTDAETYYETRKAVGARLEGSCEHSFGEDGTCIWCGEAGEASKTYTVTVDGVATTYAAGATVELFKEFYVESLQGKRFSTWSGDIDVLADATQGVQSFTMPEKDVVLNSNYVTVGDANEDGSINAADLAQLKFITSGKLAYKNSLDIDNDGSITAVDMNLMKRMLLSAYVPVK